MTPKSLPEDTLIQEESEWQYGDPIIPANRMIKTEDGRILLVAAPQKAQDLVCRPN